MRRAILVLLLVGVVYGAHDAGRWLVAEDLRKADAIVVLEGENDRRPARGLELLRQGYAPRLVLDVSTGGHVFSRTKVEAAQQWISTFSPQEARATSICTLTARSTVTEAEQAGRCLDALGAKSVLVVTSNYHTARAQAIFRRKLPQKQIAITASHEPGEFEVEWWKNREWAKHAFDEWVRWAWFLLVDYW